MQLWLLVIVMHYVPVIFCQTLKYQDFLIVILNQPDPYDTSLAEKLRDDLVRQSSLQHQVPPSVVLTHPDFQHPGAWTIVPILPQLEELYAVNSSYILFCQSFTNIVLDNLVKIFQKVNRTQEKWYGHALRDKDPTIIHHFAFPKNPSVFKYPNLASGIVMTTALLQKLVFRLRNGDTPKNPDFSIDASHELALYIWEEGKGPELIHLDGFCAKTGPHCALKPQMFAPCTRPVDVGDLYFAVKTCSKFHSERLPVVRGTWGKHAPLINFFSDVEDPTAGTINLGIPNTERGHCGKTLAIIRYAASQYKMNDKFKWLIIADDDTILSVARLQQLLSCYNSSARVAIGERYGYNVILPQSLGGYNYITGGGGMVFSMPLVKDLAKKETCSCPSNSAPDDMYLGICLANLKVPITHSPHFHQARPSDYARNYLVAQKPVSFHKHWMVDPFKVYYDWFGNDDILSKRETSQTHEEL